MARVNIQQGQSHMFVRLRGTPQVGKSAFPEVKEFRDLNLG